MFCVRPTGIRGRIACRQLSKTQNDTVNARHVAFRPAHFRNVITSVLSQSRHRRACPAICREFCGKFTALLLHRERNCRRLIISLLCNEKFIVIRYVRCIIFTPIIVFVVFEIFRNFVFEDYVGKERDKSRFLFSFIAKLLKYILLKYYLLALIITSLRSTTRLLSLNLTGYFIFTYVVLTMSRFIIGRR